LIEEKESGATSLQTGLGRGGVIAWNGNATLPLYRRIRNIIPVRLLGTNGTSLAIIQHPSRTRVMSEMDEDEEVSNIDSALLSRADLLDAEYPNRPKNTSPSLKFRDLVCSLFEAMVELQHKPRTRKGPQYSAVESRRNVINRFIQRWRNEVGPDIYPAFRLIMPDRDKDRPMYGLKEASLGKMLVAVGPITSHYF
jgi:hypothetical protein